MYIEKRIKLKNNIYYIQVDVEYKKNEDGIVRLITKNYKDSYYDGGDFSILLEKVEESYTIEKSSNYDNSISYMADVLYLYDRIPFLSAIRTVYMSNDDNLPYSIDYISKDEIEKYIEENNVKMNSNDNFKLNDQRTWFV